MHTSTTGGHTGTHESTLRRRAARRGLTLRKVRADSQWYHTHGPFMLVDVSRNAVGASGIAREEVAAEIEAR
jgi:hypothetical protein